MNQQRPMTRTVEITRRSLVLILVFLSTFSALIALPGQAVAQKKAQPKPSPTTLPQTQPIAIPNLVPSTAIPLPQIAPRAEELIQKLREMDDHLTLDPTLSSIDQSLRSQEELIGEKQHELDELIAITPTRTELLDVEQEWLAQRSLYSTMRKTLTERAKAVEGDLRLLESQRTEWETALNQIQDPKAIETVFERIRNVLSEIQNTSMHANELMRSLLEIQDKVSQQNQIVLNALKKISQAKAQFQRSLLEPDSPPLWKAASQQPSDQPLDHRVKLSFNRNLARTREFIKARRYTGLGILSLFLVVLGTCFAIRHRIKDWIEKYPDVETPIRPFQRPVSLAILTVLMVILPMMIPIPVQVRSLVILISLAPVLRLLAPLIRPVFRPLLYVLVVFGITGWIWETVVTSPGLKRWGLVVLGMAVIAISIWLTRRIRRQMQPSDRKARLVINAIYLSLALILVSLTANVFGYVGLSRILRSGTFLSTYSAVILYTAYLVTACFLSALIQMRQAGPPSTISLRGKSIISWPLRLMRWAAYLLWAYLMLNSFTIREPVLNALTFSLTTPIKLRAASFTLGDVLTFILVVVVGIGLAGIIRVVFRENVLARLKLKHGIPYAISTITYYLLLLVVVLLALSSAGVELSKFTVLTGAFGVGVGFGLQNVINNFVSGIILLFERPIRIGDFLELDRSMGEVIRMGMRSSSIRTPQGAEVIVPNSNLISNQVINWTLTEIKRRAELQFKVASGADPEKVSELLIKTVVSHPDVMREPRPVVFFLGFGDNSLDFEMQFWVPRIDLHLRVKSEVAMRIAHEFREAGIEIPAPRRELYVTGANTSVKELLAPVDVNQTREMMEKDAK
jgi:potassium-dependent mechanosensitive channel